jgi:ComEC/Rec2-related protein
MWYTKKIFLSLAGLVAGISLLYKNCPILLLSAIILFSFLLSLENKRTWIFTVFMMAGMFTAYIHIRIPANDITKISSPLRYPLSIHTPLSPRGRGTKNWEAIFQEAKGEILSVKPGTFSTSYVVRINNVLTENGEILKTSGKILLKTKHNQHSSLIPGTPLVMQDLSLIRIQPPKNPCAFDYNIFMQRRGVYMEGHAEKLLAIPRKTCSLSLLLHKTRDILARRIEKNLVYFPEEKELVETITLGKEKIPDFLREAGIRSGTYHLLVISGLHIAFILIFLKILLIPFAQVNNKHPKFFPFLSLLFMWAYAGITGFRIPVVRAVLMLSFFNAGEILERDIDGMDSITTAAVLMLLANPYNLFDASFQLSFIATAGIILFCRRFSLLKKNYLQGLVLSSLAAQLAVFPLLLHHFGVFYPAGLLNNILFLPFTGLLVIVSLLSFILPFLFEPLRHLLTLFLRGITVSSQYTPFVIKSPASLWLILFFWGASFLAFYAPRKKPTTVFLTAVTSLSVLLSIALPYTRQIQQDRMYLLSFSKPSALFVTENNQSIVFLADHYRRPEIKNTLYPLLRKERIKTTAGLFYTTLTYNHNGTLKALQKTTEIQKVYEHPGVRNTFSFPYDNIYFYRSFPDLFQFIQDNGEVVVNGLSVEVLGEEKGMLSYVLKKGKTSILLAPYLGEQVSAKIRDRRFSVACIHNIGTKAKTRKNLETLDYLYLILPQGYKKFANLPHPRIKTFYLKDGAVKINFSLYPFLISHFYE